MDPVLTLCNTMSVLFNFNSFISYLWFILFVNIVMEMKVERNVGREKIEKLKNFIMPQYYKSKGV